MTDVFGRIAKLSPHTEVQNHFVPYKIPLEIVKLAHTQYAKDHSQSLEDIIRRGGFGSQEIIYYLYASMSDMMITREELRAIIYKTVDDEEFTVDDGEYEGFQQTAQVVYASDIIDKLEQKIWDRLTGVKS